MFLSTAEHCCPSAEHIKESISYDKETGNINVLVVGIDDVEGGHRSDTIGLATIDIDDKIVRFMSLQEIHEYKSRGMAGKTQSRLCLRWN